MKFFIAGGRGMLGSAIKRAIAATNWHTWADGYTDYGFRPDYRYPQGVYEALHPDMDHPLPDCLIIAAARVGGIGANIAHSSDFLADNALIAANLIRGAAEYGIKQVIYCGSSCVYPKNAPQPIKPESLLTGPFEETNSAYALAKCVGIRLVQAYRDEGQTTLGKWCSVMPCNLYGPGDNYDPQRSHVIPALIRKFHEALPDKPVTLWGDGSPRREFLHVDDVAQAIVGLATSNVPLPSIVNIGSQIEFSIARVAQLVQDVVGHEGPVRWDETKPNGVKHKLMDSEWIRNFGWGYRISLQEGLEDAYSDFLSRYGGGSKTNINR